MNIKSKNSGLANLGFTNPKKWLVTMFLVTLLGVSCATGPEAIPYDLTPMELIQRGQEASARSRFSLALLHYRAVLERFPHDIYFVCAAEYEIAFLHYRRRDFDTARYYFNNLLARYETDDWELLPPQFRVLSNVVLARIDEAETSRRRW